MTVLAPLAKLDIERDYLQPFGFGGLSMWGKYLLNRFNRQLESHCYHQLGRGTLTQTPAGVGQEEAVAACTCPS